MGRASRRCWLRVSDAKRTASAAGTQVSEARPGLPNFGIGPAPPAKKARLREAIGLFGACQKPSLVAGAGAGEEALRLRGRKIDWRIQHVELGAVAGVDGFRVVGAKAEFDERNPVPNR